MLILLINKVSTWFVFIFQTSSQQLNFKCSCEFDQRLFDVGLSFNYSHGFKYLNQSCVKFFSGLRKTVVIFSFKKFLILSFVCFEFQ